MPFARAEGLQPRRTKGIHMDPLSQCPSLGPRGCNRKSRSSWCVCGVSMPFARAEGLQLSRDGRKRFNAMSQCPSLGPRGCNSVKRRGSIRVFVSMPFARAEGLQRVGFWNWPPDTRLNALRSGRGAATCYGYEADSATQPDTRLNALRSGRGVATPPRNTLSNRRQFGVFFGPFA